MTENIVGSPSDLVSSTEAAVVKPVVESSSMSRFPTVTFLNHSSISVASETTTIVCDPWFTGSVFDNGWRLLYEDSHDLGTLPYDWIWLSHEHPDHFSIPTLKQIKRRSRFIYQTTPDGKVRDYLSRQHEVHEIAPFARQTFGDIECRLYPSDGYDSGVLFTLPTGLKVLNINDCRVELNDLIDRIAEDSGEVDLLTIQFSYANWAGNPGDAVIPALQHTQVVERIEQAIRAVKPKAVLLFASYVYFSHEENFFWNQFFWLDEVIKRLSPQTKLIVPKPNDVIDLRDLGQTDFTERNAAGIKFWSDLHDTRAPRDRSGPPETLQGLKAAFASFHETMWRENDLAFARETSHAPVDLTIHLTDLNETVRLELYSGEMNAAPKESADVHISSEVLKFLFKNKFGRGTITINGRIQFNYETAYKFFVFFFIYYANNIGRYLKPGGLSWPNVRSIENTAVLDSIFATTPEARAAYDRFIAEFLADGAIGTSESA